MFFLERFLAFFSFWVLLNLLFSFVSAYCRRIIVFLHFTGLIQIVGLPPSYIALRREL